MRRSREDCLHVTPFDHAGLPDIGLPGMDLGRALSQGRLECDRRRKGLVLDPNLASGGARLSEALRCDKRYRLAHIADDLLSEDRLVVDHIAALLGRDIVWPEHGGDP